MQEISKAFGRRLKALRLEKKWSQEELAHRAGIATSFLSEIESGKKEPCLGKLKQIADGLGLTISTMMRGF